jgi:hypothetical protein
MEIQEKKLRCKMSTFKTDLSFNQWVEKYKVSHGYIEPTKYYQNNPSCGITPYAPKEKFMDIVRRNLVSLFAK